MIGNMVTWMAAMSTNMMMICISVLVTAYGGTIIITMKKLRLGLAMMIIGTVFPILCCLCANFI